MILLFYAFRFAIPYYECGVDYGEKCQRSESFQDEHKKFLELSKEACDEDTLLHAGIFFIHTKFFKYDHNSVKTLN